MGHLDDMISRKVFNYPPFIHLLSSDIFFSGPRVIFYDLRDSFIASLYSGSVEHARLDIVIQQLDSVS